MKLEYNSYTLEFKFDAGTSRGILKKKKVWFIKIKNEIETKSGIGEVAPLWGLSQESEEEVIEILQKLPDQFKHINEPSDINEIYSLAKSLSSGIASVRMGLEMALIDYLNGGFHLWFDNDFSKGTKSIPINGLVWMGDPNFMKSQVKNKLNEGFQCVKMKVGALDFEEELKILEFVRSLAPEIELRVDANGGFKNNEALLKLKKLEPFNLHSIEQPILPGQPEAMQLLCAKSKVPIALDEELIGISDIDEKTEMLKELKPKYIVLKPSLLGGFKQTDEWIRLAESMKIGWWITSSLESNVGLHAISQFVANYDHQGFQGLGTGSLYNNNTPEETFISSGFIKRKVS